ncbi:hypothetical protein CYMTET_14149 [Cymbomonas tetramitiformis]|uniref:beta-galactoside alpha-(2,6)-sialyltransferase n=1 Tax=Cymbomonas tetramitiformis TaxID=36881 RepID=A0AAE0GGN1_9CHLO|nr:hypothetical protein CYMTET_14149 [Cymbomonas tetramitiformis]
MRTARTKRYGTSLAQTRPCVKRKKERFEGRFGTTWLVLLLSTTILAVRGDGDSCAALYRGRKCTLPRIANFPPCITPLYDKTVFTVDKSSFPKFEKSAYWGAKNLDDPVISALPPASFLGRHFHRTEAVRSCAVISSSPDILNSSLGNQIDQHDLVMRFNNAITKGFEKDVGSKTTLRFTNKLTEGFREGQEAIVAFFCNTKPCKGGKNGLRRLGSKKVHALHPDFIDNVNSPWFRKQGHVPTSGFLGVMLLLHVCSEVHLYGFSVHTNSTDSASRPIKLKRWYWVSPIPKNVGGTLIAPSKRLVGKNGEKLNYGDQTWEVPQWLYACEDGKGVRTCSTVREPRPASRGLSAFPLEDDRSTLGPVYNGNMAVRHLLKEPLKKASKSTVKKTDSKSKVTLGKVVQWKKNDGGKAPEVPRIKHHTEIGKEKACLRQLEEIGLIQAH